MSSSSTELNCWKKDTQSSALHVMRCEDSSLMFKMPTEKMQWIHLSAAASINNWQIPSYSQIIASTTLPENYLYFFFPSTRLFYSWITFSITFTLHISQSMCQHRWSAISAASIATAVKYSPVKLQSWRSGHPKLHYWVQPTSLNLQEKKNKTSKDHTSEIYDKFPWKCQSKVISEIVMFTFLAASWKLPRKTKTTALQNLPSCPQFTSWPQIQLFMVSPDLKISW